MRAAVAALVPVGVILLVLAFMPTAPGLLPPDQPSRPPPGNLEPGDLDPANDSSETIGAVDVGTSDPGPRAARVRGRVLTASGSSDLSGALVYVYGTLPGSPHLYVAQVAADGAFDFLLDHDPNDDGDSCVLLMARLTAGDTRLIGGPVPFSLRDQNAVLVSLHGATLLRARVVAEDGTDCPNAKVLITQLSQGSYRPMAQSWEADRFTTMDTMATADPDGRIEELVRPGHIELRAQSPAGTYGVPVRLFVRAGETLDVGPIPMPADLVSYRIEFIDEVGSAVPGAALRLSDRIARLGQKSAGDEVCHFLADDRGVIRLDGVPRGLLPLDAAAGSLADHCSELILDDTNALPSKVVIQLRRKHHLDIRLCTPSGVTPSVRVFWCIESEEPTNRDVSGSKTLVSLRMHTDVLRVHPIGHGLSRAYVGVAGTYHLSGTLSGGIGVRATVRVEEGQETPPVVIEVPEGRAVRVALLPIGVAGGIQLPGDSLLCRWSSTADQDVLVQGQFEWVQGRPSEEMWVPDRCDRVSIAGAAPSWFPWEPVSCSVPVAPGDLVTVRAEANGAGECRLHVTDAGRRIRAPGLRVTVDGAHSAVFVTDDEGFAHVLLKAGQYIAVPSEGVGPPIRSRFRIVEGDSIDVPVPLR